MYLQNNIQLSHAKKNYNKLIARLKKAIEDGRFAKYSTAKKRELLRCISRYESRLRKWGIALAASTLMILPANMQAQSTPAGSEYLVNTYTTNEQRFPAIALDSDGDFVITWESRDQDGSIYGIFAQRYNSAGVAQGSEFQVNTYTTASQFHPDIAMDDAGNFIIVYNNSGVDVFAQRFDSLGVPVGTEFTVNPATTGGKSYAAVAMDADGDFVISWQGIALLPNPQEDGYGIYAQRYNSAGVPQGNEIHVNTYTTNIQQFSQVAMDDDGDFVITWYSYLQDGSFAGVFAQRFDNAGIAQGNEFQVNTYTTFVQDNPEVAMDSDGDFVIAWNSFGMDYYADVFAQRYNSAGVAQGGEFQVNSFNVNDQKRPSIAMDANGNFIVCWASNTQDGDNNGIYAQAFNNDGTAAGSEFKVNTTTLSAQEYPAVSMDNDGDFVAVWQGYQNVSYYNIYAQRYLSQCLNPQNWYADLDGDGFGAGPAIPNCEQPAGTSQTNNDCDDNITYVYPGAPELCNGVDDNCNNRIDENVTECPAPSGLATTDITSTTATLQWTLVPCGKSYTIRLVRLSDGYSIKLNGDNAGITPVAGLLPATEYKWYVRVKCSSILTSVFSPWKKFTTTGMELQQPATAENNPAASAGEVFPVRLSPNPASGNVHIYYSGLPFQRIAVTDITGRVIRLVDNLHVSETDLDISGLSPGLYYIQLWSSGETVMAALAVTR